jgi:hypothetical protein
MWIFWWRRKTPPATNAYDVGIAALDRSRKKESVNRLFELAKDLTAKLGPGDHMRVTTVDGSIEVEKGETGLPVMPGTSDSSATRRMELPPSDDEELW